MRCFELVVCSLLALSACQRERRERDDSSSGAVAAPLKLPRADAGAAFAPRNLGCTPGKHRCVGENLEACDPEQGGWTRVNVCQTAAHCNGALQQCLVDPCVLGEYQCDGPVLQQCHANGWEDVQNCGSREKCDATNGACR